MSLRSRLGRALDRGGMYCRECGCTEDQACQLEDGPCHWIAPGLCSNPECVEAVAEELCHGQLDDPEAEAGIFGGFA